MTIWWVYLRQSRYVPLLLYNIGCTVHTLTCIVYYVLPPRSLTAIYQEFSIALTFSGPSFWVYMSVFLRSCMHFEGLLLVLLLLVPTSILGDCAIQLVVSTHLKNISQNGNLPQIGVKMKNFWNHHPVSIVTLVCLMFIWTIVRAACMFQYVTHVHTNFG